MLALVGGSGDPSTQVRPSGPSTRPWGQPQVKLPAVFRQRCEQRVTPVLHSSTSGYGKEEGLRGWSGRRGLGGPGGLGATAGRASRLTHVTVLPTPAGGALAPVRPDTGASVQAGFGADSCGHRKGCLGRTEPPRARLPEAREEPASPSSQVSAPGCRFFHPWQHTACTCRTSLLTSRHAMRYVVLEHSTGLWTLTYGSWSRFLGFLLEDPGIQAPCPSPVGAADAPSRAQGQVGLIHRLAVGLVVMERDH